jgi:L-lactate dehydrogenase complex protein LldG
LSTSRESVLSRVRSALGRSAPLAAERIAELRAYIAAHPSGPRPRAEWDLVTRFRERALQLSSTVDDVESMTGVPEAISRYLTANKLPMKAVVWPELATLDWRGAGIEVDTKRPEDRDLVGITGAYCALAETGTLLLLSGPTTTASMSLVPETHIAILKAARIVKCMEDAWALLRAERGSLPRSTNFVSGPSRTADIEQTLVLGAHGPYRVHVVLVHDAST